MNNIESFSVPAMGTVADFYLRAPFSPVLREELVQALSLAQGCFSRFIPDSDVSRLNKNAGNGRWIQVHPLTAQLLVQSQRACLHSQGLCNTMIGPLVQLWPVKRWLSGLAAGKIPKLPGKELIGQSLALVRAARLEHEDEFRSDKSVAFRIVVDDRKKASLACEQAGHNFLDLGAVAKGFTADWLLDLCKEAGAGAALVSLGGSSVSSYGQKADGPWKVGIKDPFPAAGVFQKQLKMQQIWVQGRGLRGGKQIDGPPVCVMPTQDAAFSTSGDYLQALPMILQSLNQDGKDEELEYEKYPQLVHHLIDPRTGMPTTCGVRQASVQVKSSDLADSDLADIETHIKPGLWAEVGATTAIIGGLCEIGKTREFSLNAGSERLWNMHTWTLALEFPES